MLKNPLLLFFVSLFLAFSGHAQTHPTNLSEFEAEHSHNHGTATDLSKRPRRPVYYAELEPMNEIQIDGPVLFRLTIKKQKNETAKHKDFKVMHGRRLHLMLLNTDLTDYMHIHPQPEDLDGDAVYEFEVTPSKPGVYQMYADVVTADGSVNYILPLSFTVPPGTSATPELAQNIAPGEIQREGFANGLTFKATMDPTPVKAGENIMLDITVSKDDEPYRRLEPTMQAYAHLVGFTEDLDVMIHAHPMGEKLTSSSQRGGPNLMFHLVFPKPGGYRLFLQVKSEGEDVFVPFDVNVM